MQDSLQFIFFFAQVLFLFQISRANHLSIFRSIRIFIKNDRLVFILVSLLFLPGTIIHEISHFLAAIALALNVRDISIFPKWKDNSIKLGSVTYEKKDVVRGVLVGIAPFLIGLFFFWFISAFSLFPSKNLALNILFGYLVFVVSSTMFSSKQDLVDLIYLIPIVLIIGAVIYVFKPDLGFIFSNNEVSRNILDFLKTINLYLFISIAINVILYVFLVFFKKAFSR